MIPAFVSGSADLTGSNLTIWKVSATFGNLYVTHFLIPWLPPREPLISNPNRLAWETILAVTSDMVRSKFCTFALACSSWFCLIGVREHGMSAIMNGMAAYGKGLIIPAGGTFFNFVSCDMFTRKFLWRMTDLTRRTAAMQPEPSVSPPSAICVSFGLLLTTRKCSATQRLCLKTRFYNDTTQDWFGRRRADASTNRNRCTFPSLAQLHGLAPS